MKVVIGGTFEYLHTGHRKLIEKAFELGDFVLIGITSDEFKGDVKIKFQERKKAVEKYVSKFGKPYRVVEINDIFGPTLEEDFDVIVVSKETKKNAEKINKERKRRGMKEMKIVTIPTVLAEDLLPVTSTRIKRGEINEYGKRIAKMKVKIGSENPSKVNAVKMVFSRIFKFPIEYIPVKTEPDVPPQPFEEDTIKGAINRAKKLKDCDYCIGIEAGLFWDSEVKRYFDRAYCAILDKFGYLTLGHSGGFYYPPPIIEMVKNGMEVGDAMEKISGIKEIKKKMGAIGFLSKGLINRDEFNSQAVIMAMIPRISRELYE